MFFAGILLNHFSPFRQNNSRAFAGGAVMTVPSGVSFGAFTLSLAMNKAKLERDFGNLAG